MKVSVIGLGKLGLPLAAVYAESGHIVNAYDSNTELIKLLTSQNYVFNEPKLADLLNKNHEKLNYVNDFSLAFNNSEIISVIVPTPSRGGVFSNETIFEILNKFADELKNTQQYKLINIVSTVMPGSCVELFIPLIESRSGKIHGKDFGLCYSPEFIALGSVVENLQLPDMILIGASDKNSAVELEKFSKTLLLNQETPIMILNLTESEIVKIAVNNFITMKISFANMINQLTDSFPNADAAHILNAIGMDSRIGNKYLKPGTPFGGPCFPRDTIALSNVLKGKVKNDLPSLVASFNLEYSDFLFSKIEGMCAGKKAIGVIGVTYKSDTSVIEESFAFYCINRFLNLGYEVNFWDTQFNEELNSSVEKDAIYQSNLGKLVQMSDILLIPRILNNEEKSEFLSISHNLPVIDLWH